MTNVHIAHPEVPLSLIKPDLVSNSLTLTLPHFLCTHRHFSISFYFHVFSHSPLHLPFHEVLPVAIGLQSPY